MKYKFQLVYELDCPLHIAVVTYLDAEHYIFLHRKYTDEYVVTKREPLKTTIRQSWKLGGITLGYTSVGEYRPPNQFLNYGIKPDPRWIPSFWHLVDITTHLIYTEIPGTDRTLSTLNVEVDLPFFLWPLRKRMRQRIERLKIEKDDEDIVMIKRREKIYGRGNLAGYLHDGQFLLYKDAFVEHFGHHADRVAKQA